MCLSSLEGCRGAWAKLSWGERWGTPWTGRLSITDNHSHSHHTFWSVGGTMREPTQAWNMQIPHQRAPIDWLVLLKKVTPCSTFAVMMVFIDILEYWWGSETVDWPRTKEMEVFYTIRSRQVKRNKRQGGRTRTTPISVGGGGSQTVSCQC